MSYRLDNRSRDRKYGKIEDVNATVETRELADKVSRRNMLDLGSVTVSSGYVQAPMFRYVP